MILLVADLLSSNIVYNTTTSLWACCGTTRNNSSDCRFPTKEIFHADPPTVLLASLSAALATVTRSVLSSASIPSITSFTTSSSTRLAVVGSISPSTKPASAPSKDQQLDSGTKAGIATGAVLFVVLVVAIILGILLYGRRTWVRNARAQVAAEMEGSRATNSRIVSVSTDGELSGTSISELKGTIISQRLTGTRLVHELGTSTYRPS